MRSKLGFKVDWELACVVPVIVPEARGRKTKRKPNDRQNPRTKSVDDGGRAK